MVEQFNLVATSAGKRHLGFDPAAVPQGAVHGETFLPGLHHFGFYVGLAFGLAFQVLSHKSLFTLPAKIKIPGWVVKGPGIPYKPCLERQSELMFSLDILSAIVAFERTVTTHKPP